MVAMVTSGWQWVGGSGWVGQYLEETGLESSERTSNSEVKFLASIDGERFIVIGRHKSSHGGLYIFVSNRTELGSEHNLQNIHNLVYSILTPAQGIRACIHIYSPKLKS